MGNRNGKCPTHDPRRRQRRTPTRCFPPPGSRTSTPGSSSTGRRRSSSTRTSWSTWPRTIGAVPGASILVPTGDTTDPCFDNPTNRQFNAAHIPNGHIYVPGVDATVNHPVWGYLGVAGSYTERFERRRCCGPHHLRRRGGRAGRSLVGHRHVRQRHRSSRPASTTRRACGGSERAGARAAATRPMWSSTSGAIVAYTTLDCTIALGRAAARLDADHAGADSAAVDVDQFNQRLRFKFGADGSTP